MFNLFKKIPEKQEVSHEEQMRKIISQNLIYKKNKYEIGQILYFIYSDNEVIQCKIINYKPCTFMYLGDEHATIRYIYEIEHNLTDYDNRKMINYIYQRDIYKNYEEALTEAYYQLSKIDNPYSNKVKYKPYTN